jgi:uncharacterized protein
MAADDLNAPLGRKPQRRRSNIRVPVAPIIAGALGLFLGVFVLWAMMGDDPFGGEPISVVSIPPPPVAKDASPPANTAADAGPRRYDGPNLKQPPAGQQKKVVAAPGTTTIDIINGTTGAHEEVTIPAPNQAAEPTAGAPIDPKFAEMTPQGPLPKIAVDGVRPADAFAQPVGAIPGKPDAPRIALIISGLGVSAKSTADAIAKLPGPVTLAFIPYGADAALVARARAAGHEILLQVPMEPFDYPENDPGPETLLTSLAPQQNTERLHWLMSRFQGYVGLIDMMGARFTASEQAFGPVLQETGRRGLIFVDNGANPRSVAGRIAGANNLPFARADVVLDEVPTPAEIDRALARLEATARERHVAVGIASALPVSIAHIAKWAKSAASRGLLLVPITDVAMKDKQS